MIPVNEQIIVKNFRKKKFGYLLCEAETQVVVENREHTEAMVWDRKDCLLEVNVEKTGHGK